MRPSWRCAPRRASCTRSAPFSPTRARPCSATAATAPPTLLPVLARGPGWLAVDKPAGVAVHPYRADETGTLLNALAARHPELHGVGEGGLRSGVVHRLDLETSGVVLFATEEASWQRLRAAFRERRVQKVYRALVRGQPGSGSLELALVTARHRPALVRVLGAAEAAGARGARRARQSWRTLESFADAALVEVRPETGFLHQIRAMLAHQGAPVLGDRRYGPADVASGAPRHMLHAASVAFEEIRAESPDAPDFAALLARLRSEGS